MLLPLLLLHICELATFVPSFLEVLPSSLHLPRSLYLYLYLLYTTCFAWWLQGGQACEAGGAAR